MNNTKSLLSWDRTDRKQTQALPAISAVKQGDVLGPQGRGRPLGWGSQVRSTLLRGSQPQGETRRDSWCGAPKWKHRKKDLLVSKVPRQAARVGLSFILM